MRPCVSPFTCRLRSELQPGLAGQARSLWPFPLWTLRVRPTLSVIAFGFIWF
jgi:hypothetical protein